MTSPEPTPLTAEEQALAQRLSRLGARAEPSPALDARILAAAQGARQAPALPAPPRRRRWPAVLGVAASLVLAVGLAWRMRPMPAPSPAPRPVAAVHAIGPPTAAIPASAEQAQGPVAAASDDQRTAVSAPPVAKPAASRTRIAEPLEPSPGAAPMAKSATDTVSPMSLPPPPPPPAPPAPEAMRDAAATAAAPAPAPAEARPSQEAASGNEAEQAVASGDNRQEDEPTDEIPPATVDSPEVRDAWLQRIHRLVDAGDIAGARASLREFERRYPDYPLAEDLRALGR